MASEAEKRELRDKITRLVDSKFGGDWTKAFDHYAANSGAGSLVERDDLKVLLKDAGIGNWITRGAWADGVIEQFDKDKDKKISADELRAALESNSAIPLRLR
jgi:hypothetical protein